MPRPMLRRHGRDSQTSDLLPDLLPSSPPAPFSDTDDSLDDRDAVGDVDADAEEEEEGEDLFAQNLEE